MKIKDIIGNSIQVIDEVKDWEEAVRVSAQPLLEQNKIKSGYVEEMIKNIRELGPYVVLMPKVAMPHARPDENVLKSSLSLLKINSGVSFSEDKERVYLLFCLAAEDSDKHIEIIENLGGLLCDDKKIEALLEANNLEQIKNIL